MRKQFPLSRVIPQKKKNWIQKIFIYISLFSDFKEN